MRANYKMQRIFIEDDLAEGTVVVPSRDQTHYLANVLRMSEGAEILLFNGRDGEWRARLTFTGKKKIHIEAVRQTRPQPPAPGLVYLFAPLRVGRLDYMVQKTVEMGIGVLQPVLTHHTQLRRLKIGRLEANAIKAAEQCGVLAVPEVRQPVKLPSLIADWPADRRIFYCDEAAETENPVDSLKSSTETRFALLVGPEGGFSEEERDLLRSHRNVTAIPLGPRILRADTAAVAALAVLQATIGDWR